tara:strand:+ start:1517 stop:1912 length:396 start_codon:yes stop_codon:yes gene_type:complete
MEGYTLTTPTTKSWERRSQVVDHVVSSAEDIPAYSQIVNLTNGERFSLTGECLHLLDESQWAKMLNILVISSLIVRRPIKEHGALNLMLGQQVKLFLATIPQAHQDEVVNHTIRLLQSKANPKLEGAEDDT